MDVDKIKSLKKDSVRIACLLTDYRDRCKDTSCDKHGCMFNGDDRFSIAGTHRISIDSWYGYYGNSSCYSLTSIRNEDLFWKYFDLYVNMNKEDIFKFISERFKERMAEESETIQNEINNLSKLLEEIKK